MPPPPPAGPAALPSKKESAHLDDTKKVKPPLQAVVLAYARHPS